MARPLRIEIEGAFYHVMARGNARQDIFLNDVDREAFLENLGRVSQRFDWSVWAWCLMDNHYHLLIETRQPTLSKGMREVNGVYTPGFKRRLRRVGHVLQGRYKAILVDQDAYLPCGAAGCGRQRRRPRAGEGDTGHCPRSCPVGGRYPAWGCPCGPGS